MYGKKAQAFKISPTAHEKPPCCFPELQRTDEMRVQSLRSPRPLRDRLYLTEVAVREECRRLGLGSGLLTLVEDVARHLNTREVTCNLPRCQACSAASVHGTS